MTTVVTRGKLLSGSIKIPINSLKKYMEFLFIQEFYGYSVE